VTHKEILDELRQPVRELCERIPAGRGATEDQVAEALGVAILMNGGPGTVHAPRAFEVFHEYST